MGQLRGAKGRRMSESDEEEDERHASSGISGKTGVRSSGQLAKLPSRPRKEVVTINASPTPTASYTPTPQTTPQKAKPRSKVKSVKETTQPRPGAKTIHSFFNAATQIQKPRARSPAQVQEQAVDELEDIEDGPSDVEQTQNKNITKSESSITRKRSSDVASSTQITSQNARKFFKAADGSRRTPSSQPLESIVENDLRPWTERYAPQTLDELVVHKKKVSDVRQWLDLALQGHKHKRLLVLKGAAGSGKTATLNALSKTMEYRITDWKNPAALDFDTEDYISLSAQFEDFLGRGRRFGGLDIVPTDDSRPQATVQSNVKDPSDDKSQILVIEEFPSNIQRFSAASQAFRSCILQFLSVMTSSSKLAPLVMVISESLLSSSSSSADNFTAHRLLGPEVLHHPSTTIIEFNAVAPTFISKALSTILQKRSRDTGYYYSPHVDVLKKISEFGDVRNAASTLEFLCANTSDDGVASKVLSKTSKTRSAKSKASMNDAASKKDRDSAMSLVSLRESTIGLFHAVGKVVYNKRVESATGYDDGFQPPDHIAHHTRRLQSEVDFEALIDETGTDTSTFLSALHENYLLSCTPADGDTEAVMDSINGCLDALCNADILGSLDTSASGRYASFGEGLRQSELAFQVGVRGLIFSLPSPVKRQALPGRSKGDAFRMFYPADLKLYKEREELRGSLQMLTARAMSGTLLDDVQLRRSKPGLPVSQPGRVLSSDNNATTANKATDDWKTAISIGSGHSAIQEMLMERLPYLDMLMSQGSQNPYGAVNKQIRQVTRFTGVRTVHDEEDDDGSDDVFGKLPVRQVAAKRGLDFMGTTPSGDPIAPNDSNMQSLALSDDDIEDD